MSILSPDRIAPPRRPLAGLRALVLGALVGVTAGLAGCGQSTEVAEEKPEGAVASQKRAAGTPRDCADILAQTPGSPSGTYTIQPIGSATSFQAYCDMTTDGGGWTMVFKVAKGVNADVVGLWNGYSVLNESNAAALNVNNTGVHYMNRMVSQLWNNDGTYIGEVRVGVYAGGLEKKFFQFDSRRADRYSWFNSGRLIKSSYSDLPNVNFGGNFFSIAGDFGIGRTWFINNNYNGCNVDAGWLTVINSNRAGGCSWETSQAPTVSILYANSTTLQGWQSGAVGIADVMAVFVRPQTPTPMDCSELKQSNANAASGVYQIRPLTSAVDVPAYCDMTTDGGGWTQVYKINKQVNQDIVGLWTNSTAPVNETNSGVMGLGLSNSNYVSRIVSHNWNRNGYLVDEVRVGVYAGSVEKTYMQFDARNADRTNWYSQARLTKTRWTDLKGYGGPNYFSIAGDSGNGRTWYVNAFYNGCPNDVGWFTVLNNGHTNPCSWESSRYPTGVGILYGDFSVNQNWTGGIIGHGDHMSIFVRSYSLPVRSQNVGQRAVNFVQPDAKNWITANGCAACHRAGSVLAGLAAAQHNGLTVDTSAASGTPWLAARIAAEQKSDGRIEHDPTYTLTFAKTGFALFGLASYILNTGNTQYMPNLKKGLDWVYAQTTNTGYNVPPLNIAVYNPNGPGECSSAPYRTGRFVSTFPNDGKFLAGQSRFFILQDNCDGPVDPDWYPPTSHVLYALSVLLTDPALSAAERAKYTNFMDSLAALVQGVYARSAGQGGPNGALGTQQLSYALIGLISAGRTPANDPKVAAMRDELLRNVAADSAWGDSQFGYCVNPYSTGMAMVAASMAGVRLDQSIAIQNALRYMYNMQNADGSWPIVCNAGRSLDVPTTFGAFAMSTYGVLNVTTTISNVSPADPGNAAAAKIAPASPSTQTVTFKLNIQNAGYVTNTFNVTLSGGINGATLSASPASLTIPGGGSGVSTITAVFPAGLPASVQAPISVVTTYTGSNGLVSDSKTVQVSIGNAPDPNASGTTTTFTAGAGATVTAGSALTLSVQVKNGATLLSNGSALGAVTFYYGATTIATVTTTNGTFSVVWNVPIALQGNQTITANFSGIGPPAAVQYASSSAQTTITVNALPAPSTPTISSPVNGYSSTNGNVTFTGTAQAGVTVTLQENGANLASGITAANGTFSIAGVLAPGIHSIKAIATNAAGNSAPTAAVTITISPLPVTVTTPAGATTTTTNGAVGVIAKGIAGAVVTIRDNGNLLGTVTADNAGNISYSLSLSGGVHVISIVQTVSGAASAATNVTINVIPTAPVISSPANNANLPNGNNVLTGSAQASIAISILDNGAVIATGTAAVNGVWNITVPLGYGAHPLTAIATNGAGSSAASNQIVVNVAPNAPTITAPAGNIDVVGSITYAGGCVLFAAVKVFDNGNLVTTLACDANGKFSTVLMLSLASHTLTANQTLNGQQSPLSVARVVVVHADDDLDGVYNEVDNCPQVYNPDQVDRDTDGLGDPCDQAPAQADSSNQTVIGSDVSTVVSQSADTSMLSVDGTNSVLLPLGAIATPSTLTLVRDASGTGNIQLYGKSSPSAPTYSLMGYYDLQVGPTHPKALANMLTAQVTATVPRTSLANYAFRYKLLQAKVKEADGTFTTIPSCSFGATMDGRCVSASIAYILKDGTLVDAGIRMTFAMKAL